MGYFHKSTTEKLVVERYFDSFCDNSRSETGWAGPCMGQFLVHDYYDDNTD